MKDRAFAAALCGALGASWATPAVRDQDNANARLRPPDADTEASPRDRSDPERSEQEGDGV